MMNQNVQSQYKTSDNLNTRISIHAKYSTNKQPFGDWIMSHYEIEPGFRILELGCGTADAWKGRMSRLPHDAQLVLSDFSEGMLTSAKQNLGVHPQVEFRIIDIQSIPINDGTFDAVIANMMLYHVPDLHRGLSEVRRVLKPGGKFYCATYGEHGIMEFINDSLRNLGIHGEIYKTFTLQNGRDILSEHFEDVQMFQRDDGLKINCVDDFVDYVMSLSSLTGIMDSRRDTLRRAFEEKLENGMLYIPKEYGMFICK